MEIRESDSQVFSERAVAVVDFLIEKYDEPEAAEPVPDQPRVVSVPKQRGQKTPNPPRYAEGIHEERPDHPFICRKCEREKPGHSH